MQVKALPPSVKHVMLVSAVPIAYPEVSLADGFMTSIENKNNWLVKTGVLLGSVPAHSCDRLWPVLSARTACARCSLPRHSACAEGGGRASAGIYNSLMNEFGEPELLDDIIDHWSGHRHAEEKAALLDSLRTVAQERGTRISIFSGDVHQCTFCFTSSTADNKDLVTDPGFMPQVRPPPLSS